MFSVDPKNVLDAIRAAGLADNWQLADEIATEHSVRECRMCLRKKIYWSPKKRRALDASDPACGWFCTCCLDKYLKQQERRRYTVTIYARPNGNDATGDGTLTKPYATTQRAMLDVPMNIPSGCRYNVDVTGIGA